MQTTKTMPMRRQPCRDDGGGVAYLLGLDRETNPRRANSKEG